MIKDLGGVDFFWSFDSETDRTLDAKTSALSRKNKLFSRDCTISFGIADEYGIISCRSINNFCKEASSNINVNERLFSGVIRGS